MRPLFFEFPEDDLCLDNIEGNFMIGNALKVTPRLEKDIGDGLQSYFPLNSNWVDLNNPGEIIKSEGKTGKNVTLHNNAKVTQVHQRSGTIIPYQEWGIFKSNTTKELIEENTISLLIYPSDLGNAEGTLYIDRDGESQADLD